MGSTIDGQVAVENFTHPIVLLISEESEAKLKLIIQLAKRKPTKRDRALNVTKDNAIASRCNTNLARNNRIVTARIGIVTHHNGIVSQHNRVANVLVS